MKYWPTLQGNRDRQIVVDHVDGDRFWCVREVLRGFRASYSQNEQGFGRYTGQKSPVEGGFD